MTKEIAEEKRRLTPTSFAILGFLAIKEFSTFELAKQVRRNTRYFWPRAKSNLYVEPKRLLKDGLAKARVEAVGDRPRTVYSITDKGREALAEWLGTPPARTRVESEVLIKTVFAPHGSKSELLHSLREHKRDLAVKKEELLTIFRQYVAGDDPYPDRVHVNVVMFKQVWDYAETETRWVDWALSVVENWPDTVGPHERTHLIGVLEEIIRNEDAGQ